MKNNANKINMQKVKKQSSILKICHKKLRKAIAWFSDKKVLIIYNYYKKFIIKYMNIMFFLILFSKNCIFISNNYKKINKR